MFSKFFPGSKNLYLNDRHEEADTHKEDRRKLYDKRILPLLEENNFTIFGEKIDPFLWDYYQSLGLAKIKPKNIFYADSYLKYPSLTKAILADEPLIKKLKQEKFNFLFPFIESWDTGTLAQKINAFLFRSADLTDWINNKSNYKQVLKELELPTIPGYQTNLEKAERHFKELKKLGFKKVVLKKERSVSGFGIFVIEKEEDFSPCLKDNFSEQKSFVLEGFIENVEYRPNFQYFITENNIEFIIATDQLLEKDEVSYYGNLYPSFLAKKPAVWKTINEISEKICDYLQAKRIFGLAGIDYIVTKQGKVYSTEVNARINGSTFPALIIEKLFGNEKICWKFFTFNVKPMSFREFIGKSRKVFIKKKGDFGIFPIGADVLDFNGELQLMSAGKSRKEVNEYINKLKSLF
ncbi:ATP-grasp domain-containing protein [Patescibacteria group bacterium]|nr:ATP-grasp domain-containing protein [Patescibacteria group bacterium]MBU2264693.1 ATP-grasp domain-containing protein [Patescibacteria group bacterium]